MFLVKFVIWINIAKREIGGTHAWFHKLFGWTSYTSEKFVFRSLLVRERDDGRDKSFRLGRFSMFGNEEMMLFEVDHVDAVLFIFCCISIFISEIFCCTNCITSWFWCLLCPWCRQILCKMFHAPLLSASFSCLRLMLCQDHHLLSNFPTRCLQNMNLNQLAIILFANTNFHRQTYGSIVGLVFH